jgi:hypothetical protein
MSNTKITQADLDAMTPACREAVLHAIAQAEVKRGGPGVTFKVSLPRAAGTNGEKDKGAKGGCVSVYGLGAFPVNFFLGQVTRMARAMGNLCTFAATHSEGLTVKDGQDKDALVKECETLGKLLNGALASEESTTEVDTGDVSAAGE